MFRLVAVGLIAVIVYNNMAWAFISSYPDSINEINSTKQTERRWNQDYQQDPYGQQRPGFLGGLGSNFGNNFGQSLQNSNSWQNLQNPFRFLSNPFAPFFMIHLKPNPCKTTSGREGFCSTRKDCNLKGGKAEGYCARGIGVCCLNEHRCGSVIRTNNSLLVNNEYPSSTDTIGNCQYIVDKMFENICQLRLDFDEFTLVGPNGTSTLCEQDTFTVVGTAGDNPQVICGENTGHHMYIQLSSGHGSARINIATASSGFKRDWKIRVTQIPCYSPYRAPDNCLQYYTDYSNVINSFNYLMINGSNHIGGLSYTICVKAREGYCGITYQSNNFSVSGNALTTPEIRRGETACPDGDFISIFTQDKTGRISPDRNCGTQLNATTTFSRPFEIRVITDLLEPTSDVANRGFSIRYTQVPC